MSVPSTPQDLINLIREKLFNNTSGKIDEPSIREVLEWMVKVLDAKFSLFSPELTEEQYSQWNLMLDYMVRETKGVLTKSSTAPTEKGKYLLAEPGTYTNLGGIVTTADKLNYAYFNGTTWSLIAVDMPTPINNNYITENTYNLDPNQIVPSEALYNNPEETLAGDIIKRVDINTGENVNYRETTTWHDGSAMDDSKVDGKIYRKINNKYYFNTNRINNKLFYIDDFNGVDDCEIFEKAIDFLKLIKGGTLKINREVNLKRNLHLTNVYNITIEGLRDSDSERNENATIINLIDNADSIIFEKFNKLKIRNLKILDLKGIKENVKTLELFNGYDFNISDVSIFSKTGINSRCISLGRGQGETSTFLGEITNISTYQPNGGVAIYSNATNTSLTFKKCYARGGSYTMDGTVYSSMINCATDGSKTNGYLFKGTGNSYLNSFSLISCGAEVAQLSAIKVESGVVGLSVIGGFHSGVNKRIVETDASYATQIGSLITTEITDINHPIQSILIENPTIVLPVGFDVYGGLYTGDIIIVSFFGLLSVGGDLDFIKNNYTVISSKSEISDVTIKNKLVKKFNFFSIENYLVSASTNLSGNLAYLYPRINGATITNGFVNRILMNIPEGYTVTTEGFETTETIVNGLNVLNKKVVGELAFVVNGSDMSGKLEIGVELEKFSL